MSDQSTTNLRSPLPGGRPALYLVVTEGPVDRVEIAKPIAETMTANRSMAPVTTSVPAPIRWLAGFIAAIRWLPIAWHLLYSIPSEARQAWSKAFGPNEE